MRTGLCQKEFRLYLSLSRFCPGLKAPKGLNHYLSERYKEFAVSEGFEPPVRCRTPVFEAGSFNHSDNSPLFLKGHDGKGSRHTLGLDDWT